MPENELHEDDLYIGEGDLAKVQRLLREHPEWAKETLPGAGWVPLHFAAMWGNLEAVKLLHAAHPAAAAMKDNYGQTPADRAKGGKSGDWQAVVAFLQAPQRPQAGGSGMQGVAASLPQAGQQSLKFYHGTSWNVACEIGKSGFLPSSDGCLGRGIYVAREDKARRFAENSSRHGGDGGSGLIEVIITFSNPKYVSGTTRDGSARATTRAAPTTLPPRPTWSGA